MNRILPALSLTAVVALAVPATAGAKLGGQPTMHQIDAHHATLEFAADELPRKADGTYDARIVFTGKGRRVGKLKAVGTHGTDIRYQARFTSRNRLRAGVSYTARFYLGDDPAATRKVRLHPKDD